MKRLSEANAIAGFEDEVANILKEEFEKRGLNVKIDEFGNVIAYRKLNKKPLVIAAHMDEIGLSVRYIDKQGFIRFIKIGGIDDRILLNQKVLVKCKDGYVEGVIGVKPIHVQDKDDEEKEKVIKYKKMFIDIGARSKKECEKIGIEIGNPIFFKSSFSNLLNNRFSGKALDDRIGCYILVKLADFIEDNIVLLGTTQEEVSIFGKGAAIAAYHLEPKAFIAIDTSVAGDHPEISEEEVPVKVDKGPVITLIESSGIGNIANRKLANDIIKIAKENKIKYQLESIEGGATDAATVYNVKGGIPSIAICVPVRYIHSCISIASKRDVEECIRLMKQVIQKDF